MADSTRSDLPTKTVTAPDGSQIHYPILPADASQPTQSQPAVPAPAVSPETWRERLASVTRAAVERAGVYGKAAVDALVVNDWKALTDAHSSLAQRVEGGADLASWALPGGKVAEIAGHALGKAAELAAQHGLTSGIEHAARDVAAGAIVDTRSVTAKRAGQQVFGESDTWDRHLTTAESRGEFKNHDDTRALLGPASRPGEGFKRDWHHIVEQDTVKKGIFPAERVHNIENVVAIPRDVHQLTINSDVQRIDPRLGPNADGAFQNVREYLKDKPWQVHVDEGERLMRQAGLDPARERAATLERFKERMELHDRLVPRAQSRDASLAITPGLSGALTNDGRSTPSTQRDDGAAWTPGMSHDDFAKLQARIRGGVAAPDAQTPLHVEVNGTTRTMAPTQRLEGTILSVEGDRVVQHIGRGTATWSREELARRFDDPKALDAMLQPGHYVNIGADRNGQVDVRERGPDHVWQSLGQQPLSPHQQSQGQSLGR